MSKFRKKWEVYYDLAFSLIPSWTNNNNNNNNNDKQFTHNVLRNQPVQSKARGLVTVFGSNIRFECTF